MQKFGLFDLIEKLSPLEKTLKNLNLFQKQSTDKQLENPKKSQEKPVKTNSSAPYYLLIKKHEEISKRIDKSSKLNSP